MMVLIKNSLPGSIPFLLILFLTGLILLQLSRTSRLGRIWLWGLFLLYLGFSMPAVGRFFALPLTKGFSPLQTIESAQGAKTVVLLDGGTLRYGDGSGLLELPNGTSALRALEARRVAKLIDADLIVVSGGDPTRKRFRAPEASVVRDSVVRLGVSSDRILLDSESLNTREHALNLIRILRERGVSKFILVTSPTHIRRSISAFRAAGADPVPSPSSSPIDDKHGWEAFCPSPESLLFVQQAAHDYLGLAYYKLRKWL